MSKVKDTVHFWLKLRKLEKHIWRFVAHGSFFVGTGGGVDWVPGSLIYGVDQVWEGRSNHHDNHDSIPPWTVKTQRNILWLIMIKVEFIMGACVDDQGRGPWVGVYEKRNIKLQKRKERGMFLGGTKTKQHFPVKFMLKLNYRIYACGCFAYILSI